ncbi:unnamed protein product [Bursaphelenchus xylophilus]|uniref:(pine wood nematode) hypothetical protein n=1 Tax=Bursaphelenchus xylophilus TaxID=6326 RepID=A0A1I7RMA3_BURXY|nr:unnamed protein product [Bursaphelenchus xylophilus]CAG9118330.1 unnamed protein product [Bursaphelenchus xylophilus]
MVSSTVALAFLLISCGTAQYANYNYNHNYYGNYYQHHPGSYYNYYGQRSYYYPPYTNYYGPQRYHYPYYSSYYSQPASSGYSGSSTYSSGKSGVLLGNEMAGMWLVCHNSLLISRYFWCEFGFLSSDKSSMARNRVFAREWLSHGERRDWVQAFNGGDIEGSPAFEKP